jgi:hypothetical protein
MKGLIIASLLLLTSCQTTIKSPVTQIEYTGTIDKQGISITALPPFWSYACNLWEWLTTDQNGTKSSPSTP